MALKALDLWTAELPPTAQRALEGKQAIHLVIPGPPRTKKNSPVLVRGVTIAFLAETFARLGHLGADTSIDQIKARLNAMDIEFPHPRLLPSAPYRAWHQKAQRPVIDVLRTMKAYFPISHPVHVRAHFYRDADIGDLNGYTDGLADFLEDLRVLSNDKFIRSWDGTRLYKDSHDPRIEVWISPYAIEADGGLFARKTSEWAAQTGATGLDQAIPVKPACPSCGRVVDAGQPAADEGGAADDFIPLIEDPFTEEFINA